MYKNFTQGSELCNRILLPDRETVRFLRPCTHQIVKQRSCRAGSVDKKCNFMEKVFAERQFLTFVKRIIAIA